MSRIYENGYRIEYPNVLAYAGQPMLVRVTNASDYTGVGVSIKVGEAYYTETRELYNGSTTFDISRYAQMAFVGGALGYDLSYTDERVRKSTLSQQIEVAVMLTSAEGSNNALSFGVTTLYGYMAIGQSNGGLRTRRWFVNYPQSFDFYNDRAIDSLEVTLDGDILYNEEDNWEGLSQVKAVLSGYGYRGKVAELQATGATYLVDGRVVNATSTYRLVADNSTSGIYLRWLDHFGQWCYYLFRVTGRNYKTADKRSWQDSILRDEMEAENNVFLASGQAHKQMTSQETISLGARLVDAEEFDFLLSLTSSPIVEVMVNAREYLEDPYGEIPQWERVSIVGGSYSRSGAPLQDFIVSIARNAHNSQML